MNIIGLMSGTSCDGVDAALCHCKVSADDAKLEVIHSVTLPYPDWLRTALMRIASGEPTTAQEVCLLDVAMGEQFCLSIEQTLVSSGFPRNNLHAIASHGHTIWHQPREANIFVGGIHLRGTLQLGSPAVLSTRFQVPVVSDFRSADMVAGGQGAPLVPMVDWLLFRHPQESRVIQNIGGIANLTYLPANAQQDQVIAFDTGPGNMLIDELVRRATHGDQQCDEGGELAAQGQVSDELHSRLMDHPYLRQPPPKSTGREEFGARCFDHLSQYPEFTKLSLADQAATLTAFTASSIAKAYRDWLGGVNRVIVGGGGVQNPTLMGMLGDRLPGIPLQTHEAFGMDSGSKEAIAFALLGSLKLAGLPGNLPSVTGAECPVILGSITHSVRPTDLN